MRVSIRRWALRLAALGAGAASSLAFPEPGLWWLGWVGLAPAFLVIADAPTRREALVRSWLAGAAFLTALHYWLIPHMKWLTVPAAAFVGVFWLPVGWGVWAAFRPQTPRLRRRLAILAIPSIWVGVEWARSWEYLGGTWGVWGLTQWQVTPIVQAAALGGVWLLSFLTVAVNAALVWAATSSSRRERSFAVAIAVMIPLVTATVGGLRSDPVVASSIRVAGVQPGVFDFARDRLTAHVELTDTLEPSSFDVVVWGQSSVGLDPSRHPDVDEVLRETAASAQTDVFVNVDAHTGEGITKSTLQYTPTGPVASYGKRRLVPFGEYIPLRPALGWIAGVTEAADEDRRRGQAAATMSSGGASLGLLISYESTFPDLRRELASIDADLTVVQGSSWTFQGTWAQDQQASFEAVRAVESGRPAVLVSVSGTSAAFDARGRSLAWVPADQTGAFVVHVPLSKEDTLYVLWGDWVAWLSVGVAMAWLALPAAGRFGAKSRLGVNGR